MVADVLQALIDATLASSGALLFIYLLRKPVRAAVGARVAYWMWLLVPAMTLAVLLPVPSPMFTSIQVTLPAQIRSALTATTAIESTPGLGLLIELLLAVWIVGACAVLVSIVVRQRSFVRSLGVLTRDPDGLYRCDVVAPMLFGVWPPKIVVPSDFELRYSPEERELVLAHERAHATRQDVAVNALASFTLCFFWFNPLMYRALTWLRMDQELACDALVLSQPGATPRLYADALLKTQLATQSVWRQPVGCHWQSIHPLKERISMLKRPLPGRSRRFTGLAFIVAFTGLASYAAWAGQSATDRDATVLIDLKVTISNQQTHDVRGMMTQYVVRSGEEIKDASGQPLTLVCIPYLPDAPGRTTEWSGLSTRGVPLPTGNQILIDCSIRRDGNVTSHSALLVEDGKLASMETADLSEPLRYRFDILASASREKIGAAKQ